MSETEFKKKAIAEKDFYIVAGAIHVCTSPDVMISREGDTLRFYYKGKYTGINLYLWKNTPSNKFLEDHGYIVP